MLHECAKESSAWHPLSDALNLIQESIEIGHGTELATHLLLGRAALIHDDPEGAVKWWQKAIALDDSCAAAWLGAGASYQRLGDFSKAIEHLDRALQLEPNGSGALLSLAIVHLEAGFPSHARNYADQVLRIDTRNLEALLVRSKANVALANFEEAVPDLKILASSHYKVGEQGLIEVEINIAREDYEAGLLVAAELCEAYPDANEPLRIFRGGFEQFLKSDNGERFEQFLHGLDLENQPARMKPPHDCANFSLMEEAAIDVIIPVHNGLTSIKNCIESLERSSNKKMGRVIIIDDASEDLTQRWLEEELNSGVQYHVVRNETPQGFTKCVVVGAQLSTSSRFVVLNSDTVLPEEWLTKLNAALDSRPKTFLASPMSNCAAWQNLGPVLAADGNYATGKVPSQEVTSQIDKDLTNLAQLDPPTLPFAHGFCVIVDRKVYDSLGGLDVEGFPRGYGEFQDLALRGADEGFKTVVADDCFVGHVGSASIENAERNKRSRAARAKLYQKHTALRYLTAECLCIHSAQLQLLRSTYDALKSERFGSFAEPVQRAKIRFMTPTRTRFDGQKVCVFVAYAPNGQLLPYTEHYIASLGQQGFKVILVLNAEDVECYPKIEAVAEIVALRQNTGFDFGAWGDICRHLPNVWDSELLLFANDSLIGPFGDLSKTIKRIEESDAELFYLTDSVDTVHHFQSFFWGLKGRGLKNDLVRDFITGITNQESKNACILLYELSLRTVAVDLAGLKPLALFPIGELAKYDDVLIQTVNPTHHHWLELIERGFPFIKADFCRKQMHGKFARRMLEIVQTFGGDPDLVRLHVEASVKTRLNLKD